MTWIDTTHRGAGGGPRLSSLVLLFALPALFGQTVEFYGKAVPYTVQGNNVIVYGDIIAGTVDELLGERKGAGSRQAGVYAHTPWPKVGNLTTVPYVNGATRPNVAAAIEAFNRQLNGAVQWVPRTNETDFVNIVDGRDCSSRLGRTGGAQEFSVAACGSGTQGVLHEMGHAMGLLHQMQQPDRDRYVTLNNLTKGDVASQYEIFDNPAYRTISPYVYRSIENYAPLTGSRNGRIVLESIPPGIIIDAGQEFSEGDVDAIRRLAGAASNQVTVTSHPPGLQLVVDGTAITAPQAFNWALGSKHTIEVPAAAQKLGASMHVFGNWSDLGAQRHEIIVNPGTGGWTDPASAPAVTLYTANFVRYSKVDIVQTEGGTAMVTSPAGMAFPGEGTLYRERDLVTIDAIAGAGNSFYDWPIWTGDFYAPVPDYTAPITVVPKGPVSFRTGFSDLPVTRILTEPSGMRVIVDTQNRVTPVAFSPYTGWTPGSIRKIGIPDGPQTPRGWGTDYTRFVFDSWSDGGAKDHDITANDIGVPKVLTARFRAEYRVSAATPACGSTVTIAPASPDDFYRAGTTVTVTATPGQGLFFTGWSGWPQLGANATATAAVNDEQSFAALFNTVAQPLRIDSITPRTLSVNAAGAKIVLNGSGFTADSRVQFRMDSDGGDPFYVTRRLISPTQLEVTLSGQELARPGRRSLKVQNGQCAFSDSFFFDVEAATAPTATAAFVRTDTAASGGWKGVYGTDGYYVIGDSASLPAYVTVTPAGKNDFTWAASSGEGRALQKGPAGSTDRLASCWYADTSFNIALDFKDTNPHQVALYLLDWDFGGQRGQKIDILDSGGTVLDTRTVTGFQNGQYLVWSLSGRVTIRVTNTGMPNAVVSGLFFGGAGATPRPSRLLPGGFLTPDQYLESANGAYRLTYQTDGNLVAYRGNTAIWASGFTGGNAGRAVMQPDGNLVTYPPAGQAHWGSGSNRAESVNGELVLRDDGHLVIVNPAGQTVWSSRPLPRLDPNESLLQGQFLASPNGTYRLVYQEDGNLVLYRGSAALWASGTPGKAVGRVVMQADGNLVMYPPVGDAHWATGTNTPVNANSSLVLADDGKLAIVRQGGGDALVLSPAQ